MPANPTLTPATGTWLSDNLRERVQTAAAAADRGLERWVPFIGQIWPLISLTLDRRNGV